MSVDVAYQGLSIAKDVRVHFEEGGLFVEVPGPMPVATELVISHSDKTWTGRVRRVREGADAGMLIVPAQAGKLPRWMMELSPATAGVHPDKFELEPPPVIAALDPEPAPKAASSDPIEAAPSNRTPDSDVEGANADEEDKPAGNKKAPAPGGQKPKKKSRRK